MQFIVSTLSMRKDTTILAVHPETGTHRAALGQVTHLAGGWFTSLTALAALFSVTTGALQFAAVKGKDIFLNETEAVAYLKANYQLKNATYVHVLFTHSPDYRGIAHP